MAESPPTLPSLLRRDTLRPEQVERIWRELAREREARTQTEGGRAWGARFVLPAGLLSASVIALAASLVVLWLRPPRAPTRAMPSVSTAQAPPSLTRSDGTAFERVEAPAATPVRVALSDGSTMEVLPGAVVAPAELSAHRVLLRLQRGAARFAVRPGGPRRWVIEAGSARVEVVGTRFEITRESGSTDVRVEEGKVRVYGASLPGGMAQLTAGQTLRVDAIDSATVAPAQQPSPEALRAADATDAAAPARPTQAAPAATLPETVEALLARADRARLAHAPAQAAIALERVLREHAADPRAALAAFTLGRLRERALDDARGAAAAYAQALALGLPAALARDARARLAQAFLAAKERGAAAQAAQDYLAHHPRGAHAQAMRALLLATGAPATSAPP